MRRSKGPPAIDRRSLLYRRILRTVRQHEMLEPGDHVLAAISGGADSVFLLLALEALGAKLDLRISVAHLDHGLRGAEGRRELRTVEALCRERGLELHQGRLTPEERQGQGSLEDRLRERRYAFLGDVARRVGARRIATGHTADDQLETVLLRVLQGAGLRGFVGIRPVRGDGVIRPLLTMRRREMRETLERLGVSHVEDPSNRDERHPRNRIRRSLLPVLEQVEPSAVRGVCRSAELARADEELLSQLARAAGQDRIHGERLDLTAVRSECPSLARRIVHAFLQQRLGRPPSFELVRLVLERAEKQDAKVDLGGGLRGSIRGGRLTVHRGPMR